MSTETLPRFTRKNHGSGHTYFIDGQKVPGSTTILNKGWPKNLAQWGASSAANAVIDSWDKIQRMTPSQRLKYLTESPYRNMNFAAIKGTRIHALAEKLAQGESVTAPADIDGYVKAHAQFLQDWNAETLYTEIPVFNVTHQYAGTGDLLARLSDGQVWLLDVKSGKSVWGDHAFQLTSYKFAEYALADGQEIPMPQVDGCGVIHLESDGSYEFVPVECDAQVFAEFLAIKAVAEATENAKYYLGAPLSPPVQLSA